MPKRRANGEGSIYKRADGTWAAAYTDIGGKKRFLYGRTQQIVKDKLKEAIRQNDTGIVIESKKISFVDWVNEYLEMYEKPFTRESTYIKNVMKLRTHIEPFFQKTLLKDIKPDMLQKFLNEKLENRLDGKPGGYSSGVCIELKGIIYRALKKAVELNYLVQNPAENLKLPPRTFKEKQILSLESQKRFEKVLVNEMEENYNLSIYLLMLYTGLRGGEALGLQIKDIDLSKRELYVRRTAGVVVKKDGGIGFYVSDPKTKAGRRTIPLSDPMVSLLETQIKKRNERVELLRERWESRGQDMTYVDSGYLFLTIQGNIINLGNMNKQLGEISSRAGIERVSPHGLRHTFATRWIEAGLDIRSLAEILGHSDIKMTLNVYTHATQEQKKKNIETLGTLFENGVNL